tara:strand:- start:2663 stop:3646 length:984 start_codon:yes stop_codon:yes gene_type:complete
MTTNNEVDIPDVDNAEEINETVSQQPVVETPQELEPESDKTFLEYLITLIKNNAFVVIFVIVIIAYIFLFSSLGNRNQNMQSSLAGSLTGTMNSIDSTLRKETSVNSGDGSSGKYLLELLLWSMFVLLLLLNGILYIFNIDVVTSIKNLLGNVPQVEVVVDTDGVKKNTIVRPKEVYHIPGNHYDYKTAKAICKARGSELASYSDISKAFDKGADWCGYGWSEGQMALFPTQMEKWEKLQKIEGHENDCGRPGINGGYIDNPDVRYGVNCYGDKTPITPEEAVLMSQTSLYPKTQKELEFDRLVDYWKTKIPDILLAPFNHNNWSII